VQTITKQVQRVLKGGIMAFFGEIYSEYEKKTKIYYVFVSGKPLIIKGLFLNYNFHSVK
jgi:hypothetical protein